MTGRWLRRNVDRRTFLAWGGVTSAWLALRSHAAARAAAPGEVLQYGAGSADSLTALDQLVTAKTGIPAQFWRAGGVPVVQKVEAEIRAGRVLCNVIGNTEADVMTRWAEEGHLLAYDSPEASHFPREYRMPGSSPPAWPGRPCF